MRGSVVALVLCGLLVSATVAGASEDRLGVGVKVGTLGFGVDFDVRVNPWFALRGTLNGGSYSRSFDKSDVSYDSDLNLGAYGVLADFYPRKGNFRLTAGLMDNQNKIDLKAKPTSDVQIGDTTYTPAQVGTLSGDIRFNETAPYFGIGFGNATKGPRRVRFLLDVGLLAQGSGKVTVSSSSSLVSSADLQKEAKDIEDDISDFKRWPVLALGISLRLGK